ncbi:MAG: hypothetical protein WA057_02070 [Candidatus Magasanikiibacteriota bacterium]
MEREISIHAQQDTTTGPDKSALDLMRHETPESEEDDDTLENRLNKQLNSPEFLEFLISFPENLRAKILALSVEYYTIHRDGFGFNEYLKQLKEIAPLLDKPNGELYFDRSKYRLIIESIAKKTNVDDYNSDEGRQAIIKYLDENYFKNGFYFHGFNGAFESDIRKQGLSPTERPWDQKDIEEIQAIGKKTGETMLLGWMSINSENAFFISDNMDKTYRYSCASPEWFAQFVACGRHIPADTPSYDKDAYYRRDYEAAKQNIILLCDKLTQKKPSINPDERAKLLEFFEKYWEKFCNEKSLPKVALINRGAIEENGRPHKSYEEFSQDGGFLLLKDEPFLEYITSIMEPWYHDFSKKTPIPPSEIKIVSLPAYNNVYPKT